MKNKIGIDASLRCTGVVVISEGEMVEYFTIKTDSKDNIYKRALYIGGKINEVILKYPSHDVVLESPAFGARGNMAYNLHGAHFFLATLIFRHKGNFTQVAPTSLKKMFTGSGRAGKEDMLSALPSDIKKRFLSSGFKKSTGLYDLTDAFALANYGKG